MEGVVMEGNMRLEIGSNMGVCGRPAVHSHEVTQMLDNDNPWDSGSEDHATQALKIQRAWRQYKEKHNSEQNANRMSTSVDSLETGKEACPPASPSEAELSEAESGHQAMSVSSPEECPRHIHDPDDRQFDFLPEKQTLLPQFVSRVHEAEASDDDEPDDEDEDDEDDEDEEEDSESDSTPSDGYKSSGVSSGSPHGVSLQPLSFYKEHDRQNENVVYTSPGEDTDDHEINEQIAKRARKNNYLTLAQEFATFKKSHPEALPFNVHKIRQQQQLEALESGELFAKMSPSKNNFIPQSDDSHSLTDSPTDDRIGCFPTRKKKSRDVGVNCSDLPKTDVPDILKLDGLDIRGRYQSPRTFEEGEEASHSSNAVNCSSAMQGRCRIPDYNAMANGSRQDYKELTSSGCGKISDQAYYVVSTPLPKPEKATVQPSIDSAFLSRNTDISPPQVTQCPPANMSSACDAKKIPKNTVSYTSVNDGMNNVANDCSNRPPANMTMSGSRRECDRSSNNRSKNTPHSFHCSGSTASSKGHGSNYHHSKFSSSKEFYNSHRRDLKLSSPEILGGFDVYNIETAMPTIDWEAMEEHLAKSAKEELLWRRRNDREEIRRRLAMGSDTEDYYGGERMMRKPSLQTRLQSGMNLQICFMNETAKETEHSPESKENEKDGRPGKSNEQANSRASPPMAGHNRPSVAPSSLPLSPKTSDVAKEEVDFVTQQARLQAEARMALAQAKEMAHMQMEVEKQRKKKSPIAEMVHGIPICRYIVGIAFPDGRRRTSRHVLNEMNVAQLQVIVNDLHTQIETLNEELVRLLLERDDLHMEQDSMLVDIEDLTRYLGAKDQAQKDQGKPGSSLAQQGRVQPTKSQTAILKLRLKK